MAKEFHLLKDQETQNFKGGMKRVNEISYNKQLVNVAAELFAVTGRKRWKIENEGFNIQKNHRYEITHANSRNYNAMKNHYLLVQISRYNTQLYEKTIPIIKGLKEAIKYISSDLLASFE